LIGLDVKFDAIVHEKLFLANQGCDVNESVFTAGIGLDETESFGSIEPLTLPFCTFPFPSIVGPGNVVMKWVRNAPLVGLMQAGKPLRLLLLCYAVRFVEKVVAVAQRRLCVLIDRDDDRLDVLEAINAARWRRSASALIHEKARRDDWNFVPQGALLAREVGDPSEGILMLRRRHVEHTASLEERIAERIDEIRAKAQALPLGSKERERMELRGRQADTAYHTNDWLMSPGLQPPK
jgi:hypothetical protein